VNSTHFVGFVPIMTAAARLAVVLTLLLVGSSAHAAPPRQLSAQGVLYDEEGQPADALVSIAFTLYDGRDGRAVWSEPQDGVSVRGGVFNAVLGAAAPSPLPDDLLSAHEELWLGVQVQGQPEQPRQRIVSVAYALHAAHAQAAEVALALDCVGCVGVEQLAVAPAPLADLEALQDRVDTLGASLVELEGPRLSSLNCAADSVPLYTGGGWSCSEPVATRADVDALALDSVDGLAGGTLSSDLTVTGTLAAETLLQAGNVVCDASGNCGQTLAGLQCAAGDVVRFDGERWACQPVPQPGVPDQPCTGAGRALQWDGATWVCVDTRAQGPSAGRANGFEVTDGWGAGWDGIERPALLWADAQAACVALGGRLPTPTELWRHNAVTGTGRIATTQETSYLWTLIDSAYADEKVSVRLSDGDVGRTAVGSTLTYRCVWPPAGGEAFAGSSCHGPPGEACAPLRRVYNIDRWDRAPLDYAAASNECNFYNGSIPTLSEWTEAIHAGGLQGSYEWLWTVGAHYYNSSSRLLGPTIRFHAASAEHFTYSGRSNGQLASWTWPYNEVRFRCIGKRSAAEGHDPADPACAGGCFAVRPNAERTLETLGRRAPIWADSEDRPAATRAEAAAVCAAAGGSLPNAMEFQELVHHGWPAGSDEYLWTSSAMYHGQYQTPLLRWQEGGRPDWYPAYSATASWNRGTTPQPYRCVWHQTLLSEPHSCEPGEAPTWDGASFGCEPVADGDDAGAALAGGFSDPWGNRWDATVRPAQSYPAARTTCTQLGGRLPRATELWRVRGDSAAPLPEPAAEYIWTGLPSYRLDYATTMRETDGAVSDTCRAADCTARAVRCIWPASHTNVLGGRACTGPAADVDGARHTCLRVGRVTVDPDDRAPLFAAAAAHECTLQGGWLADLRTLEGLIHAGLPGGDWDHYSWIMEPGGSGGGTNFWLMGARWQDTGDATWWWNNQDTQTASGIWPDGTTTAYRCVTDDVLR